MTYVCPQCGPDPNGADVHTEMRHVWPPAVSVAEAEARIAAGRLPLPPGARRIDPDAEAASLAEARKRATEIASWPVLVDDIREVPGQDGEQDMIFVHLRVSAERFSRVPADLGEKLAGVLTENWPVKP